MGCRLYAQDHLETKPIGDGTMQRFERFSKSLGSQRGSGHIVTAYLLPACAVLGLLSLAMLGCRHVSANLRTKRNAKTSQRRNVESYFPLEKTTEHVDRANTESPLLEGA